MINILTINGRLVDVPKTHEGQQGAFTTGTIYVYNGKDKATGDYNPSIFIDFIAFGYNAEKLKDLSKKDEVVLSGPLSEKHYTTKTGGEGTSLSMMVKDIFIPYDKEEKQVETEETPW